jgi:hypothetical protein
MAVLLDRIGTFFCFNISKSRELDGTKTKFSDQQPDPEHGAAQFRHSEHAAHRNLAAHVKLSGRHAAGSTG